MKEYEECVKRDPKNPKYYFNRGLCYVKLMEFPSGIRDFNKCISLDKNYIKAYTKKADCHYMMQEYHKA